MSREKKRDLAYEAAVEKEAEAVPRPLPRGWRAALVQEFQKRVDDFRQTSDRSQLEPFLDVARAVGYKSLRTKDILSLDRETLRAVISKISKVELPPALQRMVVSLAHRIAETKAPPPEPSEEISMDEPGSGSFTSEAGREAREEVLKETEWMRTALSKPIPPEELFSTEVGREAREEVLKETEWMRRALSKGFPTPRP
jgi:hypothetical protein